MSDPAKRQSPIPRATGSESRPVELCLSHSQEQLWFLNQLLPSSSAYNVAVRLDVPGGLNRDVLQRSLQAIVTRHEVLRTAFHSVQGAPHAVLAPSAFDLPFDLVGSDAEMASAALREASVPFDIGAGPLLRARLLGSAISDTCWC